MKCVDEYKQRLAIFRWRDNTNRRLILVGLHNLFIRVNMVYYRDIKTKIGLHPILYISVT